MYSHLGSDQAGPPPPVIFVTDDDASFRTAISRLLQASGYEVETFDSAEAFLSRGARTKVGCLVLDPILGALIGPPRMSALGNRYPRKSRSSGSGRASPRWRVCSNSFATSAVQPVW